MTVSTLASRWVWEVLQRCGAHGSLGWTAGSELFRVFLFQAFVPPSAFTATYLCLLVFQLRALTQVLQLPIEVVQASSATIKIGEEFDSEPITLVYAITSAVPPEKHNYMLLYYTLFTWPFAWTHVQVYASRVWTRRALQFCGATKGPG